MIDKSLQNLGMDYVDLYIYHMWDHATPSTTSWRGRNDVVKAGKARVYRHLQLLCLAAVQGQRPGGKGRLCQIRVHPGALQPALPGGGAGDGALLPGRKHRHDALQRFGGRAAFPSIRGDLKAPGGGQLRQAEVRRHRPAGRPHRIARVAELAENGVSP